MIFATPDFGAGAAALMFLCFVWVAVIAFAILGLVFGAKLCKSDQPRSKRYGIALVLVSGAVPLCCCLLPPQIIRMTYGNYPLSHDSSKRIRKGLIRGEVEEILGTPHSRMDDGVGDGSWYYWKDSFGISYIRVRFGEEGRVTDVRDN